MNPCVFHRRVCRRLLMRFDSAVGKSSGVVPGQDFVGPVDDGVDDEDRHVFALE